MDDYKVFFKYMLFKLPPADIPAATPRASRRPIAMKGDFGTAIISFVTTPARYLRYRIEKYTATYLPQFWDLTI